MQQLAINILVKLNLVKKKTILSGQFGLHTLNNFLAIVKLSLIKNQNLSGQFRLRQSDYRKKNKWMTLYKM